MGFLATALMGMRTIIRFQCYRELGKQFTTQVTLEIHKLITTGPYSYVHHPAYIQADPWPLQELQSGTQDRFLAEGERDLQESTSMARPCPRDSALFLGDSKDTSRGRDDEEDIWKGMGRMGQKGS